MRSRRSDKPVVGIPCDYRMIGAHPYHAVGDKYARAVAEAAGALPLLIPAFESEPDFEAIFAVCDGLFLTGSRSNVAPPRYGAPPESGMMLDEYRDATALPLIRDAIEKGVPLFAACRGMQEMNVACGGTLDPALHLRPGNLDHREDPNAPLERQYGPAHAVTVQPGGLIARAVGTERFMVNSLHSQGVDRLGDGLEIEAVAPDGTIEAIRPARSEAFALGVQWHPEWQVMDNPIQRALFEAFGRALRR